jgi:hypothetical protein
MMPRRFLRFFPFLVGVSSLAPPHRLGGVGSCKRPGTATVSRFRQLPNPAGRWSARCPLSQTIDSGRIYAVFVGPLRSVYFLARRRACASRQAALIPQALQ